MYLKRMVGIGTIVAMLLVMISSPVMAQEGDVAEVVREINKNMDALKEATEVIHGKTDVIIGVEGMPTEVADMAETVHLSSHNLEHIGVYMESYIGKLDIYKAEPEKNKAEFLVTVGKIEALRKLYQDTVDASDFVTAMELPVTGKSPHELVHVLVEDPDVKASPEAKSAADAIHNALHDFDDTAKYMRCNLEVLEYTLAELEEPTPTPEDYNFTHCSENQLRETSEEFIKSYVGEGYFNKHYIYAGTNVGEGQVTYNVQFDVEVLPDLGPNQVRIYIGPHRRCYWIEPIKTICEKTKNVDCRTVWYANGIFERLEPQISKADAIEIAKNNNVEPQLVVFSLRNFENRNITTDLLYIYLKKPYCFVQMKVNPNLERTIIIDSISGEFWITESPPPMEGHGETTGNFEKPLETKNGTTEAYKEVDGNDETGKSKFSTQLYTGIWMWIGTILATAIAIISVVIRQKRRKGNVEEKIGGGEEGKNV